MDDLEPGVDSPIVQEAIDFFDISSGAEQDNRERGLKSLRFAQGGDDQWDDDVLRNRRLPGLLRPSESYNQIPNFVNQVANDARMNMSQTKFVANEDGDEETAEKMEDTARDIQTQSDAEVAYDTAFYGQCVPGWGYWRYVTDYENDKTFDQIIKVKAVENCFMVYDDPFVTTATQLDRNYLIESSIISLKEYNRQYGKGTRDGAEDYDEFDLTSIGDKFPNWASKDGIRVAEFWKRTFEKSKLYRNKKTGKVSEDEPKGPVTGYEVREVMKPKVMWYLVNGREVIEKREWLGCYIPYVKVVGHEVNINGKIRISGLVERMIPAQKMINYFTNSAVETMALAPLSPWIADPAAIAPYQDVWDKANLVNYAYLPADTWDEQGRQLQQPKRSDTGVNLTGHVAMVQQAQQNFYNLSGIYPASLGQASNEKSGKAIIARQKEGDVATFHIHDNMSRGQRTGGIILADLMPKIYDGSRKVQGKKVDGKTYLIPINQRYKEKGKSKEHDFTKGTYSVAVTTGPSYTTKRQEAAESQIQLAQAYPALMEVAGPQIVRNFDWPGADKIADALERAQPPQLRDPDSQNNEENPIPPAIQAQMQQMQQIVEQLGAQLQQAQQQLEDKNADIQNKQADLQLKQQQLMANAQSDQLKAETDRMKLELDAAKLELEREKMQHEAMTIQHQTYQQQLGSMGSDMALSREALLAQLQALDVQEEKQAQDQQVQTEQQMMAQMEQEQMMQMQAMKEAEDRARSDALLQGLAGLQQMVGGLIESINAPKTVVRGPDGRVMGIQTVSRTVN